MIKRASLLLFVVLFGMVGRAHAGGYDTPILYSARHMGMGGAAAGYVNDPSALFHNPAGLAYVGRGAALANISPVVGGLRASPEANFAEDIKSETTFAPFFLVGGAARFNKYVVAGLGVYPVASAGGEYKYTGSFGADITNRTTLLFLETSPALAFNLPGNVHLGVSYRLTYVSLERYQGSPESKTHDFNLSGFSFAGFRVGAQWHGDFGPHKLKIGGQYRHKTVTEIENDEGIAAGSTYTDVSTKFTLPSRFVLGGRYDVHDFGVVADLEYALNSQNEGDPLIGTSASGSRVAVPNPSQWDNAFTLRTGLEYRFVDSHVPVRLGYIWDQKTSNKAYPNAFGTPPAASNVITAGTGWNAGAWQVNAAVAYRMSEGRPNAANPAECPFCGAQGDKPYEMYMVGGYLDFSYEWK